MIRLRWLSLGALLALGACGAPPPAVWRLPPDSATPPYAEALKTWTRNGETYEDFESRLFVRATYFSPAFATSYATRRAQRLGMTPDEARAERRDRLAAAEEEARFFVAVVTNDFFWNDLDRGPAATFRARLISDAEQVAPTRVRRLSDDELADMKPFFPYADALVRAYWLTFPLPAARDRVHLRIAGAPAIVDLEWTLR